MCILYSTFTKTSQMFLDIYSCSIYLNNPKNLKTLEMLDKGKGSAHWTKEKETPLLLTLFLSNVIEMFIKSCILIPTENVKVIIIYLFCHILPCDGAIFKLLPEPSFCFACLGPSCSRHDCFCKINLYCCLFVICIILFILHHFIYIVVCLWSASFYCYAILCWSSTWHEKIDWNRQKWKIPSKKGSQIFSYLFISSRNFSYIWEEQRYDFKTLLL